MAGASYLNSEANAKMAISTCDSRIHADNTALAAAGVMQYHWNLKKKTLDKTIEECISLECKADLAHEGYKQLSQHMGKSSNPDEFKTKGSKRMKALENEKDADMSPEKKAIKAEWQSSLVFQSIIVLCIMWIKISNAWLSSLNDD